MELVRKVAFLSVYFTWVKKWVCGFWVVLEVSSREGVDLSLGFLELIGLYYSVWDDSSCI